MRRLVRQEEMVAEETEGYVAKAQRGAYSLCIRSVVTRCKLECKDAKKQGTLCLSLENNNEENMFII